MGYDLYDRFDLGSPDHESLYGTETGLKHLAGLLNRTSTSLHIDTILKHAGFSDLSTDGFADSGGYPGLAGFHQRERLTGLDSESVDQLFESLNGIFRGEWVKTFDGPSAILVLDIC